MSLKQELKSGFASLKGKIAFPETTSGGAGDRGGAPQRDWRVERLGASPPAALVALRQAVEVSVLSACGVPPALAVGLTDGTMARESYRQFLHLLVRPLGKLVAATFSEVLEQPVTLQFDDLGAADVQSRARAWRQLVGREAEMDAGDGESDRGVHRMSLGGCYRVSNMGAVSPVDGLDKSTILSVSAVLEISWPGGHLDLASDDDINVDVAVAQEIRDAFAGTPMSEIPVLTASMFQIRPRCEECAFKFRAGCRGRSWESSTVREVNIPTSFELVIRVLAPAERSALLSARTILRARGSGGGYVRRGDEVTERAGGRRFITREIAVLPPSANLGLYEVAERRWLWPSRKASFSQSAQPAR